MNVELSEQKKKNDVSNILNGTEHVFIFEY